MKVLIVDDESHVRDAIRLLLPWDALGFERILDAESGQEAMQLIWQERPELAIVDVVIGDTFGMEVMNYINDKRFNTKVIVISGHDDFQYVRAMFILGALEYLLKPIEQDKLEIAVRRAVDRMREEHGSGTEEFVVDQNTNVYEYSYGAKPGAGVRVSNSIFSSISDAYIRPAEDNDGNIIWDKIESENLSPVWAFVRADDFEIKDVVIYMPD